MSLSKTTWTDGHTAGVLAFTLWGMFPLYWKLFSGIDATLLTTWRLIFTAIFLLFFLTYNKSWKTFAQIRKNQNLCLKLVLATILISSNWFIFIWAVNHGATWETSLGYYISPLISVLLGTAILKEKLSLSTKLACITALVGIILLLATTHTMPIISLSLAITFSLYGFIKRGIKFPALLSLTFEVLITIPLCGYLLWSLESSFSPIPSFNPISYWVILSLSGLLTILPLYLYNISAQRIPLNNLGMLQFISPTFQFLTAYFIFQEVVSPARLLSFSFIWIALLIYFLGPILGKKLDAKKS